MEDPMKIRVVATSVALASLLAVAACDSRDYESEIATLEADVQTARGEAEQLQTRLDELRAQSEAQALPEGALDNVQTELNNVAQNVAAVFAGMGAMTEDPEAAPEERTEAIGVLRDDMQKIMQSIQTVAADLGIELETVAMDTDADAMEGTATQPEPAAGPAPLDEPAATEEQPATAQ
jgi:chromosome segregation ATPase